MPKCVIIYNEYMSPPACERASPGRNENPFAEPVVQEGNIMRTGNRFICLLLALVTALGVLAVAACGEKTPDAPDTDPVVQSSEDSSTEADTSPKFAEADYGGETFTVYMRSANLSHYMGMYIVAPENASDIVNDQVTVRNNIVEEKYNINFKFIQVSNPVDTMKRDITGGDIPYDITLDQRAGYQTLAYAGLLRNFLCLEIDYTTPWWDANAASEYCYADKLFIMPNDVSVSNISGCRFFFFNKAVLEDFKLTSPYTYVAQNEWTIDTFFTMVKSVSAPGADGQIGVYGLSNEEGAVRGHMLTGIGSFLIEYDEDRNIVCKIGTDYAEKTQDFFDKIRAVTTDKNVCIDFSTAAGLDPINASKYPDQFYHVRALFSQGHFLFTMTSLGGSREFEEMEKGFGPVMNPKYNSDQKEYYHAMDSGTIIWALPNDPAADKEKIANILDFWAYTSTGTVMEAYYELTMKTKRATDPTAAEMLDTVKGSIRYYITDLFSADVGSFANSAYNISVTQAWKALSVKIPRDLERLQDKIKAIED